jgi:hypothetical protein
MGYVEDKRQHDAIELLGMRAQATTVGLIQLSIELKRAGVLDDSAVGRIKDAIAKEICLSRPKSIPQEHFHDTLAKRLDRLFSGETMVGEATPETFQG